MGRESCIKVLQDVFERDMACVGITLTHEALEAVIEYLKDVPSADVPHWIPCSERLPIIENNNRARVLITTSWGFVKEAYYCVDHWEINDIDYILTSVIAWMPLPEPYKDGEQNETD